MKHSLGTRLFKGTMVAFLGGVLTFHLGLRADSDDASRFVATNQTPDEYELHFTAVIDGGNRITIKPNSLLWELTSGSKTTSVTVNGLSWDWEHHRLFDLPDDKTLLPEQVDFRSVKVEMLNGGDIVACEPSADKLVVYVDDTAQRPVPYDFILHLFTAPNSFIPNLNSEPAHLKISAQIDGSDRLIITKAGAKWEHKGWSPPTDIRLNDVSWSLDKSTELKNAGATQFLPPDVDFSTMKIVGRSGRDLVSAISQNDQIVVSFADCQSGNDHYEIELSFGEPP